MHRPILGVAVTILMANSLASAQDQPKPSESAASKRMPDGLVLGQVPLYVLMDNPRVVKELELTEEQTTKLVDFKKEIMQRRQDVMKEVTPKRKEALASKNIEELNRINESRNSKLSSIKSEADNFLTKKILDAKQTIRLKEIRIQAEGPEAFKRPEIQEALGITEDQQKDISLIIFNGDRERMTMERTRSSLSKPKNQDSQSTEQANYEKAVSKVYSDASMARVSTMKSIEAVLLDSQRAAYRRLVGKTFSFTEPEKKAATEKTTKSFGVQ